ncbi:uncharacterized protein LOC108626400 isoform X2 [Ceratina calcarata]|uniref:Uncharacterized protein LOC108626400 isoform X2 n=1 Tax=Ceratina calcarata TaxID=156304 RepID=A0AAJ7N8R6_9HYME|nr:uncharacterized protein LOC108626400 isoform X2 [Ceratina calcarata]
MKMPGTPSALWRWLFLAGLIHCSSCQSVSATFENKTGQAESKPRVFSPRMDYDEWTPLGRGDPLKNNPTFDYVPPVLDRVQYWLDSHTTEPSAKRNILVLGVTAKKTSPKIPEQFLKFVDGPKFTRSSHQDNYRNEFTGSSGAEPPKVVRTNSFRNGPIDYRNQNRIQSIPASYYPSSYYNQKTKPYTMMLPPPLTQKDKIVSFAEPTQQFNTQTEEGPVLQDSQFFASVPPPKNYNQHSVKLGNKFAPSRNPVQTVSQVETIKSVYASSPPPTRSKYESITTPSVSFEKSNLIYQSTQTLSGGWPNNGAPLSTPTTNLANQSTRQPVDYPRDQYEIDHHVAASSNHEVIVEQNANIIVDGDSNENEEVVVGQKGMTSPNTPPTTTMTTTTTTKSTASEERENQGKGSAEKMHIVVPTSPESQEGRKEPVSVVMPANYSEKKSNQETQVETTTTSMLENTTTAEEEASDSFSVETQPIRNLATGSSILMPNRMMPHQHIMHSTMAPFISRHPDSMMGFGAPQAPMSSMMHPQGRPNHGSMHFLGSMRPNVGFRAPASMSMFPPMTHMHAPPMKSMMSHMGPPVVMDQSHGSQLLPTMFNSPPPSTLMQSMEDHFFDQHRSTSIFTTPTAAPLLPTVSTSIDNSPSIVDTYTKTAEIVDNSSKMTMDSEKKEENKDDQKKIMDSSSSASPQITTVPSLTTDPIFSHYKQPAKPIRGPMYLIIQGHSKVKTYKPTVSKHGVPLERNEILESATERQLSKFEQFVQENTKNGNRANAVAIEKKKIEEKARAEKIALARQNDLMSLVESGLVSFTVSPTSSTADDRGANSVTTIEINAN